MTTLVGEVMPFFLNARWMSSKVKPFRKAPAMSKDSMQRFSAAAVLTNNRCDNLVAVVDLVVSSSF